MSFNLAVILRESARSHPDKPALAWEDGALSYAELDRASDTVAANLVASGIDALAVCILPVGAKATVGDESFTTPWAL